MTAPLKYGLWYLGDNGDSFELRNLLNSMATLEQQPVHAKDDVILRVRNPTRVGPSRDTSTTGLVFPFYADRGLQSVDFASSGILPQAPFYFVQQPTHISSTNPSVFSPHSLLYQ